MRIFPKGGSAVASMIALLAVAGSAVWGNSGAVAAPAREYVGPTEAPPPRYIDVVFCIDCSGSMTKFIPLARTKVTEIIGNLMGYAPTARIRVGFIRYGDALRRYQLIPLTEARSTIFANVTATRVDRADTEYVGAFIEKATKQMEWTTEADALKLIYVVGNESAAQGEPPLDYRTTVPAAVKKNIIVNAVFCGGNNKETWQEVAWLGGGEFIDLTAPVSSSAPQFRPTFGRSGRAGGVRVPLRSSQSLRRR